MLSDVLQGITYKSYHSAVEQLTDLHELSIRALHFDMHILNYWDLTNTESYKE